MIRSMTGFGSAEGMVGSLRVSVELRTVNHRFFNPAIKVPGAFARWEGDVRELLRLGIARGHATLSVRAERDGAPPLKLDVERFAAYADSLRDLQERHGLAPLDVGTVLRLPDVVSTTPQEDAGGTVEELLALVNVALAQLTRMREEEGARLADFLLERIALIESAVGRIAERAPQRLVQQRDRLRTAVRELTDGLAVDDARLAQEIAILADKLDVSEELERFSSHITAFRATLREPSGEPVGKRLGFLLQELVREANTTGSKGADSAILSEVVIVKEELERIREQVENLE
jgi:uncharacterized protein (TIGR00255 family)